MPSCSSRIHRVIIALIAVMTLAVWSAVSVLPAHGAPPAKLPITIGNETGRSGPVYLYVLGVDLASGKLGYVNASGSFTPWSLPASTTPVPAPDTSMPGPAGGAKVTINVPRNLSGRVYFSIGKKIDFFLVSSGLVQPAPWNPSDKNVNTLFDWSEFTFNDAGLWLNSSQVDQFAIPHEVGVTAGDGTRSTTGKLKDGGRNAVINGVLATPGFQKSVVTGGDGSVLRVLAPGKAADAGLMNAHYLDSYIDSAWSAYSSKTVTVVPFEAEPSKRFVGRSQGGKLVFTDSSGTQVASFAKPTTANVWGCDGALAAPNDLVVGPISRTLCAALHRGTLGDSTTEPVSDPSTFYRRSLTNHYSAIVHANMADGKAYGFAFDDVTHQESLVHSGDPQRAEITLDPFA